MLAGIRIGVKFLLEDQTSRFPIKYRVLSRLHGHDQITQLGALLRASLPSASLRETLLGCGWVRGLRIIRTCPSTTCGGPADPRASRLRLPRAGEDRLSPFPKGEGVGDGGSASDLSHCPRAVEPPPLTPPHGEGKSGALLASWRLGAKPMEAPLVRRGLRLCRLRPRRRGGRMRCSPLHCLRPRARAGGMRCSPLHHAAHGPPPLKGEDTRLPFTPRVPFG